MNHTVEIPALQQGCVSWEEFRPWALRKVYWGCSDVEKVPLGAGTCAGICCSAASTFCQHADLHGGFEINSGFGFLG